MFLKQRLVAFFCLIIKTTIASIEKTTNLRQNLIIKFGKELNMLLSNIESIPGKTIVAYFGIAQGSSVRAKHMGRDFAAGIKNIFGGELKGYTELLNESRDEAVKRMVEQAQAMGANAVVNVRFSTSSIAAGAAELFAYGTAVKVQ